MPGPNNQCLLVLMAKQPRPNHTKTRLSPPLTNEQAADLYHAFLQDKVMQMRRVTGVRRAIAYSPAEGRRYFEKLAPDFTLIEQVGQGLAARLVNIFKSAFADRYMSVIAIDGDTPTLPPAYLRQGLDALNDPAIDVVLGPCADGGYYAIGMSRFYPSLFDITMSTPHVVRDTLARADEAGLTVHCLPDWWDVDRPEDFERLKFVLQNEAHEGCAAPATARYLVEHQSTEAKS